ncbi:MAG TPA: DUF1254 domain-containing protein [Alphaproteobacteria bacterium]|jgi:hypothetical protein|nr:DUF1254 domain-containing protein [Alphaproteobacteria bacterium]
MSVSHRITRRTVIRAGLAAGLLPALPLSAESQDTPESLAHDAYIWGYPLVMFGRYLDTYKAQGNPINRFVVQSALSTPATPGGGPNVDTIYGYSWLDLRTGPQVLYVPDVGDRYYSIQLIDMYGDCFAYVGRRATGSKAGAYAIVGPDWKGTLPAGVKPVPAPTNDVMTFARTFVADEADMPAVRDIQGRYGFGDLADYPKATRLPIAKPEIQLPPILDLSSAGAGYFDELCQRLAANPPRGDDIAHLKRLAAIGIAPGARPSADAKLAPILAAAVPAADKEIKTVQYGTVIDGWFVNFSMVSFPKDPLLRASSNKYGPGAHIPEEGLYFNADKGPDGQPLDGRKNYVLRFPKGETPPVDAFWSLTAYTPVMHLIENPIKRYAIKGGMPGLVRGSDGSLEIRIQHQQPAQGPANWLPVPDGPFRLVLRTYQPRPEILDKTYKLPAIALAG